jgi:hypothetical protein
LVSRFGKKGCLGQEKVQGKTIATRGENIPRRASVQLRELIAQVRCPWPRPVILATQEAVIRRIVV